MGNHAISRSNMAEHRTISAFQTVLLMVPPGVPLLVKRVGEPVAVKVSSVAGDHLALTLDGTDAVKMFTTDGRRCACPVKYNGTVVQQEGGCMQNEVSIAVIFMLPGNTSSASPTCA